MAFIPIPEGKTEIRMKDGSWMKIPEGMKEVDTDYIWQGEETPTETTQPTQQDGWDYSGPVPQRISDMPTPQPQPSLGQELMGGLDTLGAIGGGMLGSLATPYGVAKGIGSSLLEGTFGTPQGAESAKQITEQTVSDFNPYGTPKTQEGMRNLEALGEVTTPLEGLLPMTSGVSKPLMGSLKYNLPESQKTKTLRNTLETNPQYKEAAKYKLEGNKVVSDKLAKNAISQGVDEGVVSSIKTSLPGDKSNMIKMLDIVKEGKKDKAFSLKNRPEDIVGHSIQKRVDFLFDRQKKAGEALGVKANQLKGQPINFDPAISNFINELENIGVKINQVDGKINIKLKGSNVEGDKASKQLLNKVFDRLVNTDIPDANGVHRMKQWLDTQINYGKSKANPLSKTTEKVLKGLRRDLNELLNQQYPEYGKINKIYSETKGAIDDFQKSAGTSIDLTSPEANKALGTASRKLLSNSVNRTNLMEDLNKIEEVAKRNGMKIDDNITNQLVFSQELERLFKTQAPTGLKGQSGVVDAIETGANIKSGGLAGLAKKGINKIFSPNEEKTIKALEQLLKGE